MIAYKRTRGRHNSSFKNRDSYNLYKKQRLSEDKNIVSEADYSNIIKTFNERMMASLIYDKKDFVLPKGCGLITINKYKSKMKIIQVNGKDVITGVKPDWIRTKKYWKEVYNTDDPEVLKSIKNKKVFYHLNDYNYEIRWIKDTCILKNKSFYSLSILRHFKVQLNKIIKESKKYEVYEFIKRRN